MSDLDHLDGLTVKEIDAKLKAFGCRQSSIQGREKKLEALKLFVIREKNHPFKLDLKCAKTDEELLENRTIFDGHDETAWQHVNNLKLEDVPKGFKRVIITNFLRESDLLVNAKPVNHSTKKQYQPKMKGHEMYLSRLIITCKFLKTSTLLGIPSMLVLDAQIYASMEQKRR